jgi:hypothetical protein
MSRTSNAATAHAVPAPVPPHLRRPAARDAQHAVELAAWSRLEGLVRQGREACERGERGDRIRELRLIRSIRDEALALAGYPL